MGLNVSGIEKIKGIRILISFDCNNGITSTLLNVNETDKVDESLFVLPNGYAITKLAKFQKSVMQLTGVGM